MKRSAIITYTHGIHELPHELPNDLRLKDLRIRQGVKATIELPLTLIYMICQTNLNDINSETIYMEIILILQISVPYKKAVYQLNETS